MAHLGGKSSFSQRPWILAIMPWWRNENTGNTGDFLLMEWQSISIWNNFVKGQIDLAKEQMKAFNYLHVTFSRVHMTSSRLCVTFVMATCYFLSYTSEQKVPVLAWWGCCQPVASAHYRMTGTSAINQNLIMRTFNHLTRSWKFLTCVPISSRRYQK